MLTIIAHRMIVRLSLILMDTFPTVGNGGSWWRPCPGLPAAYGTPPAGTSWDPLVWRQTDSAVSA